MDQSADTPDLQLNDTQAKRKRTSFVGKEKFIRDVLLIGLAAKCKKATIELRMKVACPTVSCLTLSKDARNTVQASKSINLQSRTQLRRKQSKTIRMIPV